MIFDKMDLIEMFEAQEALNIKYNGPEWRKTVMKGQAIFAFQTEVAEFAEEIRSTWKWWSGKALAVPIDKDKAAFELIDAVHFAMLLVLLNNDLSYIKDLLKNEQVETTMYGKYEDKHLYFAKAQYNFIESIYNENEFRALISLLNLIETGAVLIGLNEGDITKAYYLKNAQNQKRVEGGQQAGTYDKSKETPLTLN